MRDELKAQFNQLMACCRAQNMNRGQMDDEILEFIYFAYDQGYQMGYGDELFEGLDNVKDICKEIKKKV